jgi:hypothetical protein
LTNKPLADKLSLSQNSKGGVMAIEIRHLTLIKSGHSLPSDKNFSSKKAKKREYPFTCPHCREKRFLSFHGWNEETGEEKSEPAYNFVCGNCNEYFICNSKGFVFWRNQNRKSSKNFDKKIVFG